MKKIVLLLIMAAGLLSCTKELISQEEAPAEVPMEFEFNIAGTKASKTDWEDGDEIFISFKGLAGKFLFMYYYEETQEWNISYNNLKPSDFENLDELTLTAVHVAPYVSDCGYDPDSQLFFFFDVDDTPLTNYYLSQTGVPYTVDGNKVTASFTMEKPEGVVLFHTAFDDEVVIDSDYTLASPQVCPVVLVGVNLDGTIRTEVRQPGARMNGFEDEDGTIFTGLLADPAATAYTFTFASNEEFYTLEYNSALTPGKQYNFPKQSDSRWEQTHTNELYVDLGLTSGTKWAKRNLGALNPGHQGNYYAWAELQPKKSYKWQTYLWMAEGYEEEIAEGTNSWRFISKYTVPDNRTEAIWYDGSTFIGDGKGSLMDDAYIDDAAWAALGGKFHIPTKEDWQELIKECDWTWKTTEDGYYNNGFLITGPNENVIFLPAGGWKENAISDRGLSGYYWASSVRENHSRDACYLTFDPTFGQSVSYLDRFHGLSIRPVYK